VPDRPAVVVLLDPPLRSGQVRNLVKVETSSDILWRAELPEVAHHDFFVGGLTLEGGGDVMVSTWSGYRVCIPGAAETLDVQGALR
jgi:hypothetical protein